MKKINFIITALILSSCATNVAREQKEFHQEMPEDEIIILDWRPPIKIENDTVIYLK